jgi:alpha,alpha-trehalase
MNYDKKNFIQLDGNLFQEVQSKRIFQDSKTFVDSIPKYHPDKIIEKFRFEKEKSSFDLKKFVKENFVLPSENEVMLELPSKRSMSEHIELLWEYLKRKQVTDNNEYSTLIPLKNDYIIPGGRFREVYYWDSYFTMLGLLCGGHTDTVENMLNNFAYLIELFGFIPNGNRVYYLTRSQPPLYSSMLTLTSKYLKDKKWIVKYLKVLEKEYTYWMSFSGNEISEDDSSKHVVFIDDKKLNRYFDLDDVPREESYFEDYSNFNETSDELKKDFYKNIRAGAESGWDFSSRWFDDENSLSTIRAADILPVDLNCILCNTELTLSNIYSMTGDEAKSKKYKELYWTRRELINKLFWNQEENFFFDYNFRTKKQSGVISTAGCYPLFFKIAEKKYAEKTAQTVEKYLLKDGGILTTVNKTGQQWDSPNGWPPLQWIAIKGLRNYGFNELADKIKNRWLKLNEKVFNETGKMFEKYNVENVNLSGGGGEYPLQDGFGWTNGVALALLNDLDLINF